jgi:glycosyltransferase involved in cell wall biosynthesis
VTSSQIAVSVIIPARDASAHLGPQLAALARQDARFRWQVLVVDDGSTDGTAAIADRFQGRLPDLQVIRSARPHGPNAARNLGASVATGRLLVFVDADDVVADGWLPALTAAASEGDLTGGRIDHRRLNDDRIARWRPWNQSDGLPIALQHLPYAMASNLAVTRGAWDLLGGFNPAWRHGTDVELCWRAHAAGLRLRFAPDAVVHYRHRPNLRASLAQAWAWGRADARLQQSFDLHSRPPPGATAALHRLGRDLARPFDNVARGRACRLLAHAAGWTREQLAVTQGAPR